MNSVIYEIVDSFGGPAGDEFENLEDAVVQLREIVGGNRSLAYEVAILAFDDAGERVGGPITLDPADLDGPPQHHKGKAPAPPPPAMFDKPFAYPSVYSFRLTRAWIQGLSRDVPSDPVPFRADVISKFIPVGPVAFSTLRH